MKKKIMIVFGTRPEAIKMSPLVKKIFNDPDNFQVSIVVTAQHRSMLDQVLEIFEIIPDIDFNLMKSNNSLSDITSSIVNKINELIHIDAPDMMLVHGDTTTSYASALSAFYNAIPLGHVEAGSGVTI